MNFFEDEDNTKKYKAAFVYPGGKSKVAEEIWNRLGKVETYIEPFFGTGAVFFNCPYTLPYAIVNDIDGYLVNFWRAVRNDVDSVSYYADNPFFESDIHARHIYITNNNLSAKLEADPDFYDSKIAGYWVYLMNNVIGADICTGGPWIIKNNMLIRSDYSNKEGVVRSVPAISRKVNRNYHDILTTLSNKMARIKILCGNWDRALKGIAFTTNTAIFIDPPYSIRSEGGHRMYTKDNVNLKDEIEDFCRVHEKVLRIALCGYIGEYDLPLWDQYKWVNVGGYSNQNKTKITTKREEEVIWFSPLCN